MKSQEYIEGAIRTESGRFDANHVDPETIKAVIGLFVLAGQALDTIKRGLFYGNPMNAQKCQEALSKAEMLLADYNSQPNGGSVPVNLAGYSSVPAVSARIVHAALGLGTESAEILEKVLESFETGKEFDYANLFEELSDINWYVALGIDSASEEDWQSTKRAHNGNSESREWSFESIWSKNIAKLKARYPNKFETEKAYNRDLGAEKDAMK